MVIVDTTVWIDLLGSTDNPETRWLSHRASGTRIGLTDLILCEVLQGIRDNKKFSETRRDLLRFVIFDSGGKRLAVAAANNYRILRDKGYTVRKTIDCLIATFCIESQHLLLHRDHDFDPFEKLLGLRVVHA